MGTRFPWRAITRTPPASTSGANVDIGVLAPNGSVNLSTQLPSALGTTTAAIAADGQGFWVSSGTGLRYVSFGGTTPSGRLGHHMGKRHGDDYRAEHLHCGPTVIVAGITGATGYNGTYVVSSATSSAFSYYLATQPSGTAAFAGLPTSQLVPTLVTSIADNPNYATQIPTVSESGTASFTALPTTSSTPASRQSMDRLRLATACRKALVRTSAFWARARAKTSRLLRTLTATTQS